MEDLNEAGFTVDNLLHYASYSGLTFQAYDWLNGLPFEIGYIWRRPITFVKCQYVYSRYFGLLIQIANIWIASGFFDYQGSSVPPNVCHAWYFYMMMSSQSLQLMLELAAIQRLYRLNNSSKLRLGLRSLVGVQTVMSVVLQILYLPKIKVSGMCITVQMPLQVAIVPANSAITQVTIWYLTSLKTRAMHMPLLDLITGEGSRTHVAILFLFMAASSQLILNHDEMLQTVLPGFAPTLFFPLSVVVMSVIACKMIRNMEIAADASSDDESESTIPLVTLDSVSVSSEEYSPRSEYSA